MKITTKKITLMILFCFIQNYAFTLAQNTLPSIGTFKLIDHNNEEWVAKISPLLLQILQQSINEQKVSTDKNQQITNDQHIQDSADQEEIIEEEIENTTSYTASESINSTNFTITNQQPPSLEFTANNSPAQTQVIKPTTNNTGLLSANATPLNKIQIDLLIKLIKNDKKLLDLLMKNGIITLQKVSGGIVNNIVLIDATQIIGQGEVTQPPHTPTPLPYHTATPSNSHTEKPVIQKPNLPADISFLIADIKYRDGVLKILELGEGTRSRFAGYDTLYGEGSIWRLFWKFLKQFNLPTWYVGPLLLTQASQNEIAFDDFKKIGGEALVTTDMISFSPQFRNLFRGIDQTKTKINDYKGIMLFRHRDASSNEVETFQKRYPGMLVLNSASAPHVNNKYLTSLLFSTKKMKKYRPQCNSYEKKYSHDLANKIINDFECNYLVIKPIAACKGKGVIITTKAELDKTLRLILKQDLITQKTPDRETYMYWRKDKSPIFIVEEYEPSHPIEHAGKHYDATMRMVFCLHYDNNTIHITYLDGYWKLPEKALNEEGTLTEKHKSKIGNQGVSSLPINKNDLKNVKSILAEILPSMYFKMLKMRPASSRKNRLPQGPIPLLNNLNP